METIDEIVAFFGSKRALAKLLGCTPQALTGWSRLGVPDGAAIKIERLSNGRFKAVEIQDASEKLRQKTAA